MSKTTIYNRLKSFKYAFAGIADLFRSQPNARVHLLVLIMVFIAGVYFKLSIAEWSLVILCSTVVLAAEAANTAIEYLTNLVSPDYHVLAGKAKDAAAACVLLTAIGAAMVGLIIFLPKFLKLIDV